jgi:hypothetical protein
MSSGTIWGGSVEKTRGKKSRATVPLIKYSTTVTQQRYMILCFLQ